MEHLGDPLDMMRMGDDQALMDGHLTGQDQAMVESIPGIGFAPAIELAPGENIPIEPDFEGVDGNDLDLSETNSILDDIRTAFEENDPFLFAGASLNND